MIHCFLRTPWHALQTSQRFANEKQELELIINPHLGPSSQTSLTEELIHHLFEKNKYSIKYKPSYQTNSNSSLVFFGSIWVSELTRYIWKKKKLPRIIILEDGYADYRKIYSCFSQADLFKGYLKKKIAATLSRFYLVEYKLKLKNPNVIKNLKEHIASYTNHPKILSSEVILLGPLTEDELKPYKNMTIKLHPSQRNNNFNTQGYNLIDTIYPIEFYNFDKVITVYGHNSSSLFYIKAMYPHINVVSLISPPTKELISINNLLKKYFDTGISFKTF